MQTIQVRPSRNPRWQKQGGWEVYEAVGVCPVYCDQRARDSAATFAMGVNSPAPTISGNAGLCLSSQLRGQSAAARECVVETHLNSTVAIRGLGHTA